MSNIMVNPMQRISHGLQSIYHNYKVVPLVLCAAVAIDYALTFYFAGSIEMILKYEHSPLLTHAIRHDIVIPYLVFTMFFYYAVGYIVLKLLTASEMYYIGVAVILLTSIVHVLGGMSWYVMSPSYSNMVLALSLISVMFTIAVFGYEILKRA